MDAEQLRQYRRKLEAWREDLLQQASTSIGAGIGVPSDQLRDPGDAATNEADRNFTLRLRDRERRLLSKIDASLAKIRDGSYGICEECGEPIEPKRLEARPVATLCYHCKVEQERNE